MHSSINSSSSASPLGNADIYMRARICTLGEWGWPPAAIGEHVGLDTATVQQVLREGDEIERYAAMDDA